MIGLCSYALVNVYVTYIVLFLCIFVYRSRHESMRIFLIVYLQLEAVSRNNNALYNKYVYMFWGLSDVSYLPISACASVSNKRKPPNVE